MDKFGIFSVLNSFLNGYDKNNRPESEAAERNFTDSKPPQNQTAVKSDDAKQPQKRVSPPLQSSMLNVLNSHDAFIKRVRDKNRKQ